MSVSKIQLEGVGPVNIYRRRGLKRINLRVGSGGHVRLSMPWYVPKHTAINYLLSHKEWLVEQLIKLHESRLADGDTIYDNVCLRIGFSSKQRLSSIETDSALHLLIPKSYSKAKVTTAAEKQLVKFLIKKSKEIISPKVEELARSNDLKYRFLNYKNMTSRWGSCDSRGNIVLNANLLRLDDQFIDYVVVHELVHTKHLDHSVKFWTEVGKILPEYKQTKKELRSLHPSLKIKI